MTLGRRELLATAAAASLTGAARTLRAADNSSSSSAMPKITPPKRPARLRLASQENVMTGKTLSEKLDNMEKWGFEGFEPSGRNLAKRIDEIKGALQGRSVKMGAVCAGFEGCIISDDPAVRDKAVASMKEILSATGELGSMGMIMVPAFNQQPQIKRPEGRQMLIDLLGPLGEHAHKAGTRVLLEPLNRRECYFMQTVADAASICRDVNSPGICCMGDLWHMTWEETNDMGAFISGGDYIHQVHMASRKRRKMPGEDGEADNYVLAFKGLKLIGFNDFVSFECGCVGDPMVSIPAAVKLLREQWAQA